MLTYNELIRTYNELSAMGHYERLQNTKSAYARLESLLQEAMGFGPGYFAATRFACALLAADGQLTYAEHEMFRKFASSSCTYEELYDSVAKISKNFKGALEIATTHGRDVRFVAGYLAAAIYAEKGALGENEKTIFKLHAEA